MDITAISEEDGQVRIYFASGEPYRRDEQAEFTAAEAADIIADSPWAELDRDGDLIMSEYRSRCDGHHEIRGAVMAARLRRGLGLPTPVIAAQAGKSPRTAQRWLADAPRRPGPPPRADVPDALILGLRDEDRLSWAQIAERTGLSRTGARMRYCALTGRGRPERAPKA